MQFHYIISIYSFIIKYIFNRKYINISIHLIPLLLFFYILQVKNNLYFILIIYYYSII